MLRSGTFAVVLLMTMLAGCGPNAQSGTVALAAAPTPSPAVSPAPKAPEPAATQKPAPTSKASTNHPAALAAVEALIAQAEEQRKSGALWDTLLFPPRTQVVDLSVGAQEIKITFNRALGDRAWSPADCTALESALRGAMGPQIASADTALRLVIRHDEERSFEDYPLEWYVTSAEGLRLRETGRKSARPTPAPVVQYAEYAGPKRTGGLEGRNIGLGPSHGITWHKENRWQFQRAYLFTVIEDLYPLHYMNQFLIPMLERSGAAVWSTRERDYQNEEVIVDNDGASTRSKFIQSAGWRAGAAKGWRGGRPATVEGHNEPFTWGTTLVADVPASTASSDAVTTFTPYIPKSGRYYVSMSWERSPLNSPSAPVRIHHRGGTTTVFVNQQIAGPTWTYLGAFEFEAGADASKAGVVVSARGAAPSAQAAAQGQATRISVDAVRFGGGMGNVAPGGQNSGLPRWAEAAKYFIQYAGAPAKMCFDFDWGEGHFGVDYNRDIGCRAEYLNWLQGAPGGPNTGFRNDPGLGVPMDAFIAWHTDAGTSNDGLIGTLSIYRVKDNEGETVFPDGRSRWMNRDFASMVSDEICRTARAEFTSTWPRRQITQGRTAYGEARRPNMPTVLLELLSHQNFNDMKYGLDPRWQKAISRAVYKAILKFVAYSNGYEPVVQPLEPLEAAVRSLEGGRAELTWCAQLDPLEPSAAPEGFIVYRSLDGRGFDNGVFVKAPPFIAEGLKEGTSYYFRVTAANRGGESFPSPVVATRRTAGQPVVLIVDGFDRICGPEILDVEGARGFVRTSEPGLYPPFNAHLVGDQFDFSPKSEWENDRESTGWGGSHRDLQGTIEAGQTYNHAVPHAKALEAAGYSFDTATAGAFASGSPGGDYRMIDWIAGRQKATAPLANLPGQGAPDRMKTEFAVFTPKARERLAAHLKQGGRMLLSGAHVGEDLLSGAAADDASCIFARNWLGLSKAEPGATRIHNVVTATGDGPFAKLPRIWFGQAFFGDEVYPVPSAEGLTPTTEAHRVLLTYGDTKKAAALAGEQVILLGFPLETVMPESSRHALAAAALGQMAPVTPNP